MAIRKKLAARSLRAGGLALYELGASHLKRTTCPLARLGHNRDKRKNLLKVDHGLFTDARGCPVAVSVHEGNVVDGVAFGSSARQQHGIRWQRIRTTTARAPAASRP